MEQVRLHEKELACLATYRPATQYLLPAAPLPMGRTPHDHKQYATLAVVAIILPGQGRLLREEQ
jgi:hypothetical protein